MANDNPHPASEDQRRRQGMITPSMILPLYALATVEMLWLLGYAIAGMAPWDDMLTLLLFYFVIFLVHSEKSRAAIAVLLISYFLGLALSILVLAGIAPADLVADSKDWWVHGNSDAIFYGYAQVWWSILAFPLWLYFLKPLIAAVNDYHRERGTRTRWGRLCGAIALALIYAFLCAMIFFTGAEQLGLSERAQDNIYIVLCFVVLVGVVYRKLPGTKRLVVTTRS